MAAQALEPDLSLMTPLCGHTSEDTAYLQPDYPYGARLRCQRRVWVEHHPKKGMRFCAQTTDPRKPGTVWNKPKKGTCSNYICLLFNPADGHVLDYHLRVWTDEKTIDRFQAFWWLFYSRLDAFNQEQLDQIGAEIAEAVNRSKHTFPSAAPLPTVTPRIEVDVEYLYNSQEGAVLGGLCAANWRRQPLSNACGECPSSG